MLDRSLGIKKMDDEARAIRKITQARFDAALTRLEKANEHVIHLALI